MKEKRHSERIIGFLIVICIISSIFFTVMGQKSTSYLSFKSSTVTYEDTNDFAYGVFVDGDYAYVADGNSGLAVINISDPTDPGIPVYEDTNGFAYGVFIEGDYAYVADGNSGLVVINISDPTNPGIPVYEDTNGFAYGLFIEGDYAYVADGNSGLAVIDISDPTNPGIPVYEDTNGFAYGLFIEGDYAYVADGNSGLAVIDISDPTNPGIPIYDDTNGSSYGVFVSGNYAYVADGDSGLAVIDIFDPTNPGTPIYEDTNGSSYGVSVSGDCAYIADGTSGLAFIDITYPTDPGTPAYEVTNATAYGVFVSGDYAYVADEISGLAVIDISYPINPEIPVYEATNHMAWEVCVSGDYAYVADYDGLTVIDISNPANPKNIANVDTTNTALSVFISGDYAYVASHYGGLAIIDISDPTNPGTPVYSDTNSAAFDVFVSGDYAYVAAMLDGLAVINISDPTNPEPPIYVPTNRYARGVYVSGDYAYIAADGSGLAVIDISDPTNPGTPVYKGLEGWPYHVWATDVYVNGDYAYVSFRETINGRGGLAIFDISDPTNPGSPVYESSIGWSYRVYVCGDYAYLADGKGLAVIDISDPRNPETAFYAHTPNFAYGVFISGDYAYVAVGTVGFATIKVKILRDFLDPVIITTPNSVFLELGYSGENISWNATDSNPSTYTILNGSSEIIAGPAPWSSGVVVTYDIPDGLEIGTYTYTINFTDDFGHYTTDTVLITVQDTTAPLITNYPDDVILELGYSGKSISWNSTDLKPSTYTILNGSSEIMVGPAPWSSGVMVTYDIPDGLEVGTHSYTINFTDTSYNFNSNTVLITVQNNAPPVFTATPNDAILELGYSGASISWNATDLNPNTYTILNGSSDIIAGPTSWSSGVMVTYNIPEGHGIGSYMLTINFTDIFGNFNTDTVLITVQDTTAPVITDSPDNLILELGYSGASISWNATDSNPSTYVILNGSAEIIVGPTSWSSGVIVTYNIPDGLGIGIYIYTVNFTDIFGNFNTDTVFITVQDTTAPVITDFPDDLILELGFSGVSISWNATDLNPYTYTILNESSDIIAGPSPWLSGVMVTYDIPDGLEIGSYMYFIIFMDIYGNFNTDIVLITVYDTTAPLIANPPDDIILELGYSGASISWNATDSNPSTYTLLNGSSEIIAGPTSWLSGVIVTYDIPDGLGIGTYIYTINFTDTFGNFNTDTVLITVQDTTAPVITDSPDNLILELGYSGASISWTATDSNPSTYVILNGSAEIIAGPTSWSSGVIVTYDIPDGLGIGINIYTVNFTDIFGNFNTDTVLIKVQINAPPVFTIIPDDFILELGYSGVSISWNATDLNPNSYTILNGSSGIIAGPTSWLSGVIVTYDIPDGLGIGSYTYTINFSDIFGNFNTDTVLITVQDTTAPVITDSPDDLILELGYSGASISWNATDLNPNTYTILNGSAEIIAGPNSWLSGVMVTYDIPDGLEIGTYSYTINFTDNSGHYTTDTVLITVQDTTAPVITDSPDNLILELGYSGASISWTATDSNPSTYTVLNGSSEIIIGPTSWLSGVMVTYDILDGLEIGIYSYTINFTDNSGHYTTDTVLITVQDTIAPTITITPDDFILELGYSGASISWNATDLNPNTYMILNGSSEIIAGPTSWSSGVMVTYDIPDGLGIGSYTYTINFTDIFGNFNTDTVLITVQDTTAPTWDIIPEDQTILYGVNFYYDVNASDLDKIERYEVNDTINFNIDSNGIISNAVNLNPGVYWIEIKAFDSSNNFCNAIINITVVSSKNPPNIPGFDIGLSIYFLGIICIGMLFYLRKGQKLKFHSIR